MSGPRRTRPVGKPLDLTPGQLDEAAIITATDVVFAKVAWQTHVPAALAGLLDATVAEGGADATQTGL